MKYFVAVAEEQNVTRAASRLHVSQPPLSRQIRDLESELGVALFERSPKSLRLTPAGQVFLSEAKAVLQRADQAVQTLKAASAQPEREINIAYAPSLTVEILPAILREFQTQSPQVRVNLHDLSTEAMIAGLRESKLDVALMIDAGAKRLAGLHFVFLHAYPMCLAVHPSHPLARVRNIKIEDLLSERLIGYSKADYPEYHERVAAIFHGLPRAPQLAEEHDSSTGLIASVEAGRGVALVPASLGCLVGPRLKLRNLTPEPESLKVGLARRKGTVSKTIENFFAAALRCQTNRTSVSQSD